MVFRRDLISHWKPRASLQFGPAVHRKAGPPGQKTPTAFSTACWRLDKTCLELYWPQWAPQNHGKNVFYRTVNPSHVVEKLEWDIRNSSWSWFDHILRRNLKFLTCWVMLDRILIAKLYTLPETNSSHLKRFHPKRKLVFQPSIFRCKLLVSGILIVAE